MIEQTLSTFLLENDISNMINDIIVDYRTSCLIRQIPSFKVSDEYNETECVIDDECYMGDVTINSRQYRVVCDLSLEDGEILFN